MDLTFEEFPPSRGRYDAFHCSVIAGNDLDYIEDVDMDGVSAACFSEIFRHDKYPEWSRYYIPRYKVDLTDAQIRRYLRLCKRYRLVFPDKDIDELMQVFDDGIIINNYDYKVNSLYVYLSALRDMQDNYNVIKETLYLMRKNKGMPFIFALVCSLIHRNSVGRVHSYVDTLDGMYPEVKDIYKVVRTTFALKIAMSGKEEMFRNPDYASHYESHAISDIAALGVHIDLPGVSIDNVELLFPLMKSKRIKTIGGLNDKLRKIDLYG